MITQGDHVICWLYAEASLLCIDGTIRRWVTALERASLRRGFDTASRCKAAVAVTSAVRGAPPLAEGRER